MSPSVALITGASSGIGREFALYYARLGFHICMVGQNSLDLQNVSREIEEVGSTSNWVLVDLSSTHGVLQVLDECNSPDVLVANAGITMAGRAGTVSWNDLEKMSFLLGTGVAQLIEGVVPSMVRKGEGTIIVVSSIASLIDMPNSAVYAASKSFATRYASSLAREVRHAGVRVTAVCPGYVHTNLHERAGLGHLEKRVPRWLWVDASTVVRTAVSGARKGKPVVVPGLVYRVSLPFLNWSLAQTVWARLTRRGRGRKAYNR
jgi:short-subunit dehydrogenase